MSTPILATKLYIPSPRPNLIRRPRLVERLNEGLQRKLTLISAPAGFGKTTLVSSWIYDLRFTIYDLPTEVTISPKIENRKSKIVHQVAWLSLDVGDNDPARFLAYLVAALQGVAANVGNGVLVALQSPQPPPVETLLTTLLNEITTITKPFVLVLDDYHVIEAKTVDNALAFLLEHLPPPMHLVIATREDPDLPLARLRARGQLTELRVADLRFTPAEAAGFLNQAMGLNLTVADIAALETRTEGWIAGLQLAALSLQGQADTTNFIRSFTGSHRFVMDYLVEEVLQQQPLPIQTFLLQTSILERMCGALCDALMERWEMGDWRLNAHYPQSPIPQSPIPNLQSQAILEQLERANLFLVPLDNERRWYRYHHLFAELLRQRLQQNRAPDLPTLHIRASQWYEENGLDLEAFHHAAAANDIERAERLIEGKGIQLHLRGAVVAVLQWLDSLPTQVKDARPALWWRHGAFLLVNGQQTGVAEKLQAAEDALQATLTTSAPDEKTRTLIGRIAAARATLALTHYQAETMLTQSRRALEYLHPNYQATRANAHWTLGLAYLYQGDRAAARQALLEAISLSQAARDTFTTILATISLGLVQEAENQLHLAAESYRRVLHLTGEQPLQIINEAHLGLARILYEWNDLAAAEEHARQSLELARQYDRVIDRFILSEIFLARLQVARGDLPGAATLLAQADQAAQQQNFVQRIPDVAAAQVVTFLRQGNLAAAAHLAQTHNLPGSQARVHLAHGEAVAALAVLEPLRQQAETKAWADERLKVLVLQALAHQAHGDKEEAVQLLRAALALAEPAGCIRLFVDEGLPMAQLLGAVAARGVMPSYVGRLLALFDAEKQQRPDKPARAPVRPAQPLIEPLSEREVEVLHLIAQGLSNEEIGQRLFVTLSTVKGHNLRIFGKLQVQRRTEAVARARALGLL